MPVSSSSIGLCNQDGFHLGEREALPDPEASTSLREDALDGRFSAS